MTTTTIHTFRGSLAEYNTIAAIHNAAWQAEGLTGEMRRLHDSKRNPDFLFCRLLAEQAGEIVAHATYGEDAWNHTPGKYLIEIEVHPDFQQRGIGSALYEAILNTLAAHTPAPVFFSASTREDQFGGVAFLQRQNFRQVMRSPQSKLDVAVFDASRFAETVEKVYGSGITLHSMSKLKQIDPDWIRHWYDLELAIDQDQPMADRGEPLPYETFAGFMDTPLINTDAAFFALDEDGNYVGQSTLEVASPQSKTISVGHTGVVRSHRRRGIATALKIRAITYAKESGVQWLIAGNEENNPMLQINLRLGFQPAPAWLSFEKRLTALPTRETK